MANQTKTLILTFPDTSTAEALDKARPSNHRSMSRSEPTKSSMHIDVHRARVSSTLR